MLARAQYLHARKRIRLITMSHLRQNVADSAEFTAYFPVGTKVASTESTEKGDTAMNANFEPAEDSEKCLEKYGSDLTALARTGKLDPVIGRDTEIRDVIRILSRKTKNNPVLIGEPGVGKTAIVEGLAQRIVRGDVPEGLKDRTVFRST